MNLSTKEVYSVYGIIKLCYSLTHDTWDSFYFVGEELKKNIRSDQLLSRVRLFETPWTTARQASLSITNS